MILFLLVSCCLLAQSQSPVTLELRPVKSAILVGESPLFELRWRASADMTLESPELNRGRTTIRLFGSGSSNPRVLTGNDYAKLHRVPLVTNIGRNIRVAAGGTGSAELNLLRYTQPLAAGTYRLEVEYRYGANPGDVVRSNAASFEIQPAELKHASWRWFGGRTSLESIVTLRPGVAGGSTAWLYQVRRGFDPGVLETGVVLDGAPQGAEPVMAMLNAPGTSTPDRVAAWVEGAMVCWRRFGVRGWRGSVSCQPHGLSSPQLVDPPLQLRMGAGTAMVLADKAFVSLQAASSPESGKALFRAKAPAGFTTAGVQWAIHESTVSGRILAGRQDGSPGLVLGIDPGDADWKNLWTGRAGEALERLFIEQARGSAWLGILSRIGPDWIATTAAMPAGPLTTRKMDGVPAGARLTHASPRPDGSLVAVFSVSMGESLWFDGAPSGKSGRVPAGCRPVYVAAGVGSAWILCSSPTEGITSTLLIP